MGPGCWNFEISVFSRKNLYAIARQDGLHILLRRAQGEVPEKSHVAVFQNIESNSRPFALALALDL
jgi:hypothetical protein